MTKVAELKKVLVVEKLVARQIKVAEAAVKPKEIESAIANSRRK